MNQSVIAYSIAAVMPTARASGLFVSLATIQQPDGVLIDAGQPSGTFVNVAGHVNIPCMDAPSSNVRIGVTENKSIQNVQAFNDSHVLLGGWYPLLETSAGLGWRAVIDGKSYDLLGAESDSQFTQTRLKIQSSQL